MACTYWQLCLLTFCITLHQTWLCRIWFRRVTCSTWSGASESCETICSSVFSRYPWWWCLGASNVAEYPDAASGLEKGRKKGTLSYDLQTRVNKKKVGLSGLPELPSESSMIRLKSASEAAKRKIASMSVQRRRGSPGEFRAVMDPYTQARCLGGQRYLKRKKNPWCSWRAAGPTGSNPLSQFCQFPRSWLYLGVK